MLEKEEEVYVFQLIFFILVSYEDVKLHPIAVPYFFVTYINKTDTIVRLMKRLILFLWPAIFHGIDQFLIPFLIFE